MVYVDDFYTCKNGCEWNGYSRQSTFNIGDKVYVCTRLSGTGIGGKIKKEWYLNGNYQFSSTGTIPEDWSSIKNRNWHTLQSEESGEWYVKLYYNDSYLDKIYFTVSSPPSTINPYSSTDDGKAIFSNYYYWYSGLSNWTQFAGTINVPDNTDIYILAGWINNTDHNIKGHVDLSVKYPEGTTKELTAEQNQDKEASSGNGFLVQFEPFKTTTGEHKLYVTTYETSPNKVIVDVQNTGIAGYFTVGVSITSTIGGSDCSLSGNVLEDLPTQYIYLNTNETKELTFNLTGSYSGLVYAIAKIYQGNSTQLIDCLDGGYGTYIF